MTKDKIIIVDHPNGTPSNMLNGGNLLVELPVDFSFELTANARELNNINEIKGSGVLGFSLAATPRNRFIFNKFLEPQQQSNIAEPFDVVCIAGGFKVLPQNKLYFRGFSDSTVGDFGNIDVEILEDDEFWVNAAKRLYLNQIEGLGSFEVTRQSIITDWQDNDGLFDSSAENYSLWTPIDYGKFQRPQDDFYGLMIEDLRPLVSLSGILRKGFKQIGHHFVSPLLDNDEWFNRLWCYLLGDRFDYPDQGIKFRAAAQTTNIIEYYAPAQGGASSNPIGFPNITNDPSFALDVVEIDTPPNVGITFDATVFRYARPGNSDYRATFALEVTGPGNGYSVGFDAALYSYPDQTRLDVKPDLRIPNGETAFHEVEFDFNLEWGSRVYVAIEGIHPIEQPAAFTAFVRLESGSIEYTPTGNQIYEGDTVPIKNLLNPNWTFWELLKGSVHLISGLLHKDEPRDIGMYPRSETLVVDEMVDGYYYGMDDVEDLSQYVDLGSQEIEIGDQDIARFIRLRFAESTCGYIDKENLEKDEPLYSKLIDLERGDENETEDYDNPFFEPTANTKFYTKEIPAMWDTEAPEKPSVDIGPRVLYCEGYKLLVRGTQLSGDDLVGWVFEGTELTNIMYLGQRLDRMRFFNGASAVFTDKSLVYGDDNLRDLYDQFWKYLVWSIKYNRSFKYTAFLPFPVYDNLDFRRRIVMYYRGRTTVGTVKAKDNYSLGGDNSVTLTIKPNSFY